MEDYQLPNDVISKGYKKVHNFQYAQIFYSKEKEFIAKGFGYKYRQIDKHKRIVI